MVCMDECDGYNSALHRREQKKFAAHESMGPLNSRYSKLPTLQPIHMSG